MVFEWVSCFVSQCTAWTTTSLISPNKLRRKAVVFLLHYFMMHLCNSSVLFNSVSGDKCSFAHTWQSVTTTNYHVTWQWHLYVWEGERDRESTHLSTVIIIISELQILFYDLKYGKYSQQIDGFIIAIVVQCLAALCKQTFYSESEY